MREAILEYKNDPEALKDLKESSRDLQRVPEEHLLKILSRTGAGQVECNLYELVYLHAYSPQVSGVATSIPTRKLSLSRGMQFLSLQQIKT